LLLKTAYQFKNAIKNLVSHQNVCIFAPERSSRKPYRVGKTKKEKQMKKVVLVLAVIATTICVASCSKKGNCTCTTTMNGEVMQTVTNPDVDKDKCEGLSATQTVEGDTTTITCVSE
jgi:hypothetical protein